MMKLMTAFQFSFFMVINVLKCLVFNMGELKELKELRS